MATYAIGDVQGCFRSLEKLIQHIAFDPVRDRLWFVGDLVNKGPDSLAVLRYVKGLGQAAVTVLGNHDLHLLAIAEGIRRPHRDDTVQNVLGAPDRTDLLNWLRQRPLLHRDKGSVLLHAGLLPQWTVSQAEGLAKEVEDVLRSPEYRTLLRTLYEEQLPARWSDDLAGAARLGLIAKTLTRLRICTKEGLADFSFGDLPDRVPLHFQPWFDIAGRKSADVTVVCGHWAALGLYIREHVLVLDSGCVYGRHLTAVRLEDRQVYQVACAKPV